jgi:hypothetical protein
MGVDSVAPGPHFTPGKGPRYLLDRRPGGPQADLDIKGRGKILCLCRGSNPTVRYTIFKMAHKKCLLKISTKKANAPIVVLNRFHTTHFWSSCPSIWSYKISVRILSYCVQKSFKFCTKTRHTDINVIVYYCRLYASSNGIERWTWNVSWQDR